MLFLVMLAQHQLLTVVTDHDVQPAACSSPVFIRRRVNMKILSAVLLSAIILLRACWYCYLWYACDLPGREERSRCVATRIRASKLRWYSPRLMTVTLHRQKNQVPFMPTPPVARVAAEPVSRSKSRKCLTATDNKRKSVLSECAGYSTKQAVKTPVKCAKFAMQNRIKLTWRP